MGNYTANLRVENIIFNCLEYNVIGGNRTKRPKVTVGEINADNFFLLINCRRTLIQL